MLFVRFFVTKETRKKLKYLLYMTLHIAFRNLAFLEEVYLEPCQRGVFTTLTNNYG